MRPKLNAIGLSMMWGTHNLIFKQFGKIGILGWKCLLRPNGTFWGDSDGTIVISRSKTPFEEKMRETFADRHTDIHTDIQTYIQTYRHTDTEIIPGKPVWHTRNFSIKKLINYWIESKIWKNMWKYPKISEIMKKLSKHWNYENFEYYEDKFEKYDYENNSNLKTYFIL